MLKEQLNIVLPVENGIKRPKWSVMIPTFNPKEHFLIQAINSVLVQDLGPDKMQIEVVDDCSTKVDVEKIVNDNWKGRVKYHRLPKNVGHSFNFTESVRRANGELVHLLHDDDKVKPGFYLKMESLFEKYSDAGAAFCRQAYIDENGNLKFYSELEMDEQGILDNALIRLAQKQRIQYCSMVVKRKVYEQIGGFITKNIGCEDWEMWVRIAAHFKIGYEPKALAEYRVHHGTSMTLKDMRSGQDMRYMREAINIFNEYLPKEKREEVDLFRRKYYGVYSYNNALRLLEEFKDKEGAAAQLSETIKIDSELIYSKLDFLLKFDTPVESAGVSVILSCLNNEDVIERTIRHLIVQRVPEYIPWEIIITDNNSTDNTIKIIENTWKRYNGNTPLRILSSEGIGILENRNRAIESAKYNFILFCNPGELLNTNYVKMVSLEMLKDMKMGVLGGYSESVIHSEVPEWYNEWSNYCYQIGEQNENTAPITWSKGYVWGSGMAIRKEAWKALYESNFTSFFENQKAESFRLGIEHEMCYALRQTGWTIWYSMDLKLKKSISEKDLRWSHLRNIWRQHGINSTALYPYLNTKEHKTEDLGKIKFKKNYRHLISGSYRKLKKYNRRKLLSFKESYTGDNDILHIEFEFAKLKELLKEINSYNKRIRLLRRIVRKKDLQYFKYALEKPYFRFPQYKRENDSRGISIVLNFTNSSYKLLYKALDKISNQILPEDFPWEVILICNTVKAEIKKEIFRKWERTNCPASLKIVEENSITSERIRIIALDKSRFDNMIFINEFDQLYPDFVRISYLTIRKNKFAGIISGQTELTTDVKLPVWFDNYKKLYGIGKQSDESGHVTDFKNKLPITAFVARKKALENIAKDSTEISYRSDNFEYSNLLYDKNLSSEIKKAGWKIFYEQRLKSKRFVSVRHLNSDFIRNLAVINNSEKEIANLISEDFQVQVSGNSNKSWFERIVKYLTENSKSEYRKSGQGKLENGNETEILYIENYARRSDNLITPYKKGFSGENKITLNGKNNSTNGISAHDFSNAKKINPGVSIVICCYNSSKLLPATLRHIISQKVSDDIKWEVIIVDNASIDNTSETAQNLWDRNNCLAPFKIVKESEPGLSAARLKGFQSAKYEYIVFCDDDNWLDENFVKNVFDIMSSNKEIGVLGGQSQAEFDLVEPKWFKDWKDSYAIGKQSESAGDLTLTRGYVWGAAMTVRKEAWNKLVNAGFKSILTDRKGDSLSAGGDTEICYALRNEGWKIWYDPNIKFKHFISEKRLNWNYLRKLFRGFGLASPGLDNYNSSAYKNTDGISSNIKSVRTELRKTINILRKTRYKKLLTYSRDRIGDTDIPMIEYCLGRVEGLIKTRGTYNSGLKLIKSIVRKKDFKYLKPVFENYYEKFPRYKSLKKLNGVSIIVCTYNGEDRLAETIRHVAEQKVDPQILWELVIVDNASTDNTKQVIIDEWKRHKVNAKLKITDEFTQGLSAARQKGFDTAKYEYIVLCDDDNWLDENFVQTTYDIMSSNEEIGILGGPNEALCELEPPEWFKWFQQGYAAGTQADFASGKVNEGNITWKRGFVWGAGMIIRKKALHELYSKGFKSIMSDRKGNTLSSGGDSELCFALVLSGWQVWYDTRLKLKHCMPAGRLEWNYLIRLFEGFGITSVGLDYYEKAIKAGRADIDEKEINLQNWKYEYKKTLDEVKKFGIKKLLALRFPQDNNTQVPMMEYYIARLKELKRVKDEYDKNIEEIKNSVWRIENKKLKTSHRKFIEIENDFRFGWPWGIESEIKDPQLNSYPKISILSPAFNSVNTIEKAILSVLKQGYPNFEHIIYDGGSTDGTIEILKKYPHLIWISEPDKGQCDAMNKAFEKSTGEIISYLNVDDYYQRGAFVKIAKAFKNNTSAEMVVGNLYFEFNDHTHIRRPEIEYKKIMLPFKYIFPINPVCYFYKRIVQEKAGPFPLDNHFTMDYWFLLKAYQNHKIIKINDYLGTFWMNGLNKTSGADNKKNTHNMVLEHCRRQDNKNLLYYLYNYYKFFYYDKKPYNLTNIWNKNRKNAGRVISVLTFQKNKYYNQKLYESARNSFYINKRFKAVLTMFMSYVIYPKAVKQSSRSVLLSYSLFGIQKTEKLKWFYFFLTTPPGLPLANKLHYFGNKFKDEKKSGRGNTLLFLTYMISPKFLFKGEKVKKEKAPSNSKYRYLNPLYWLKSFINYFRYREYRENSYNYYLKAAEKYYFHKNFSATLYMAVSFIIYPFSLKKKSRLNLFTYSALGNKNTEKLMFIYHLYKDNPEYTFAHKLDYYGNELRQKEETFKGNSILMIAYILSPKYFFKRKKVKKSNKVFVSEFRISEKKATYNPLVWIKDGKKNFRVSSKLNLDLGNKFRNYPEILRYKFVKVYHYFRYRKFKARSKELYSQAQLSYSVNKRFDAVKLLIPSMLLYPPSIFNRNKLSLMLNSLKGSGSNGKLKEKE